MMISPEEARMILNSTGIKSRAVCKNTGLCDSYVSEWLNNRRLLSQEHLAKLNTYFEKIKIIM